MKRYALLAATAVVGTAVAFQGSVNLQATTPGSPQNGHLNITGTARAGFLQGNGSLLTNLNASAMNTGVITLTGTSATYIVRASNDSGAANATGLIGINTSDTGNTYGGWFESKSVSGRALFGYASAPTGATYGTYAANNSNGGRASYGIATSLAGTTYGGFFTSLSNQGRGVYGQATNSNGTTYGVYGKATSPAGYGVFSEGNLSATGIISGNGSGLTGLNADNVTSGTLGDARLSSNVPLLNAANNFGPFTNTFGGRVRVGTATFSIDSCQMEILAGPGMYYGLFSRSAQPGGAGVYAQASGSSGSGLYGYAYDTGFATYGVSGTAEGDSGIGVQGTHVAATGFNPGVSGASYSTNGRAVAGFANATTGNNFGVWGHTSSSGGNGVYGEATVANSSAWGIWGFGTAPGKAGHFSGNVQVTGALTAGVKPFKIDHPLDPENKYLYHVAMESPDMKNIYDGNVITDARGDALVTLPDYFEALNRDFRYQLTVIGQFAQAIVAEKIKGNRFRIKTNLPNVEVSWQVTGIRRDAYANAHRIPVEELKQDAERGTYLHPEAFGQPEERGLEWALRPEQMRRLKAERAKQPQATPMRR